MNENNNYDSGNVRPYKASGNLNTAIGNPTVNINDAMNMNIQSMNTGNATIENNNYNADAFIQNNINYQNSGLSNNVNMATGSAIQTSTDIRNGYPNTENLTNYTANVVGNQNNQSNYVNKTYVTTDSKPKKKAIKLNLGPEFKIALLIMVVLLVFIFLLPMLYDFISGR